MASNKSSLPIAEPLCFHQIHGEQIRLSQNNTRATRERLNHNLVFTNRPIFPNEVLVFHVEEVSDQFHGIIRLALTTIDPETFRQQPPPRSIPINDNREWFVPSPRGSPYIRKDHPIRFKYTTEGDVSDASAFRESFESGDMSFLLDLRRLRRQWFYQISQFPSDCQ